MRTSRLLPYCMMMLLGAGTATAQPAADCRQAKTPAEQAICNHPELATADKTMAEAYAALRAQLPPEQQKALLSDQRRWVTRRTTACGDKTDEPLAQCLLAQTEARRRFLAGEGPNGAAGAARIVPALFHEARKGRYEISIEYPQVLTPRGAAATAFEQAARAIAFGKNAVKEYREMERPMAAGAENYYDVTYEVTYLDPRLVSLVFTMDTYSGGAHPNSTRAALLFDWDKARALSLADILMDPKTAVPEIAATCRSQLEAQAKEEGWELFDNADVGAVVGEAANWAADKDGILILFNPYSVAAYVVGPRECRLTYADMKHWLKPGGSLPPQ
ncbi:MAG: DUF4163 domain-containing protein [Alphaproteobacteria bacterium]|nr:DUF4163 domain-containing protein [Alphaproteobacteria bacterium]